MDTGTTIRLSFLARRKRFPALPEQPEGTVFGIVWDACPIPDGGLCYIVEFVERSRAAILGYVTNDGRVYRADKPSESAPAADDIGMVLVRDKGDRVGDVYVKSAGGQLVRASEFRGSLAGTMREVSDATTWNTEHSLVYREFMATMYLRYCVFGADAADAGDAGDGAGDTGSLELQQLERPVELFGEFGSKLLPDAIAATLYRIDADPHPSGIERYARRVLGAIDLSRLRALVVSAEVSLARIEKMNGFYINFNREATSPDDTVFLFGVESALNRLSRLLDRLGAGLSPLSASPSEEACSLIDQQELRGIVSNVGRLVESGERDLRSAWTTPGSVPCEPGGEWDVCMHLAELCESLNLLVRLEYRFDYSADEGSVSLQFAGTTASIMPRSVYNRDAGVWLELDEETRGHMAQELNARMALVLAAASFAASPTVCRCLVEEQDPTGSAWVSRAFERTAFMVSLVPKAGELAGENLAGRAALALLARNETARRYGHIAPEPSLRAPREDDRPLPQPLRELLCADTARELEVVEDPDDAYRARYNDLQKIAVADPRRAEEGLNELIEEMQAECVAAELLASHPVRTQFCENHVGRIILPIFIDDKAGRIHRAPDALFFAQYELCSMHLRGGDYERALVEARRLLDIAATSMQAHFMLINVLARLRMFDEVIDVAKHGLRAATDRDAIAYLFYRLAFAYWNQGERLVALACYRLVPSGEHISAVAREEARELMGRIGMAEQMDLAQATAIAQAAGVPIPPTDEVFNQVADAAVLLMDNGFLYLAARCIYSMWRMRGKDELGVLSRSLLM